MGELIYGNKVIKRKRVVNMRSGVVLMVENVGCKRECDSEKVRVVNMG